MIDRFRDEYHFLSNYYYSPFYLPEGLMADTVEHAFQAYKTVRSDEFMMVLDAPTPGEAKKLGRSVHLRPHWDDLRVDFMRELVKLKFAQHPDLMRRLRDTGTQELVEGNTWNDRFWGVCGYGENHLGKILMEIRDAQVENAPEA